MTRILFSALVCAVVKVKKKAHDAWPQHTMMLNYKLFPRTMHNRELCQSKKEKEKLLLNGERVNELFIRFTATLICPEQTMAFDLILNGDSWTPQECSNAIVLLFCRQSKDTKMTCLNTCYYSESPISITYFVAFVTHSYFPFQVCGRRMNI